MNSSDAQPPLSRRQARERERAAAAGAQPVTPPPSVAAPAEQFEARRRPGSHVAPAPSGPAQNGSAQPGGTSPARPASAAPAPSPVSAALPAPAQTPTSASSAAPTSASSAAPNSASSAAPTAAASASSFPTLPPTSVSEYAPASATEIVPGSGGLTRRQLRQLREAQGQAVQPVPLQNPTPQSSDRTVQDVIGSVDALEVPAPSTRPTSADQADERPEREPGAPALDEAAVAQATEADGSPDAIEPIDEAAAHAEEPRRHRSTWAPHDASTDEVPAVDAGTKPAASGNSDSNSDSDGVALADAVIADGQQPATARSAAAAATPGVFPLSLDEDDTNEVPVQAPASARSTSAQDDEADAPRVPAAFQRQPEPKPITTVFEPPVGHWSQQAHDSNDAEVHDEETGARRVAVTNTNAIVLPSSALADPTGALNATGEVILTGSIDLPASLSSTGSHRPIDGAEVDRLLEQHDEQPETDASPVRASRAISSHTSTRQVVLAAAKPKESRTPLILGVTVGAVGVAAAAVIIVALVTTHAFGG